MLINPTSRPTQAFETEFGTLYYNVISVLTVLKPIRKIHSLRTTSLLMFDLTL